MTTYELPPEPPIGESVRDALGRTWKHEGVNRWALKDDDADGPDTRSWRQLFLSAPLTLIEPDPWPTAPLIVATRGGRVARHGLFARWQTDSDYVDIAGVTSGDAYDLATPTRDTLTNVVPVTVVPVAEWEALKSDHRTRSHLADGCHICALVRATDALGVSND